ncbi:hypothetical protein V6N13_142906 [Hibiscus sabdariffa]
MTSSWQEEIIYPTYAWTWIMFPLLGMKLSRDGFVKGASECLVTGVDVPQAVLPVPTKPSFRDMVIGQTGSVQKYNFISDLDVELQACDVVIGSNGVLPEIRFSESVHRAIDEKLSKSLITRLLGKTIGYRALKNRINPRGIQRGRFALLFWIMIL